MHAVVSRRQQCRQSICSYYLVIKYQLRGKKVAAAEGIVGILFHQYSVDLIFSNG
jgi:hypothetical protein